MVSQPPAQTHFNDVTEFGQAQKRMVRLVAEIIGGDAVKKAEQWSAFFDERQSYLRKRLADVPDAQRPTAFYLRGPSAQQTHGPGGAAYWYGVLGGANMISKDLPFNNQGPMSMEEIAKRDPDYIFVGRQYSPDLVLKDPKWQDIAAVKDDHVVPVPAGMFYWDGSTEGILFAELVAKMLYPDRFRDLDMRTEVRRYFEIFYQFEFTDGQLDKFMRGLTPAGVRRGY